MAVALAKEVAVENLVASLAKVVVVVVVMHLRQGQGGEGTGLPNLCMLVGNM